MTADDSKGKKTRDFALALPEHFVEQVGEMLKTEVEFLASIVFACGVLSTIIISRQNRQTK